MRRPCWRTVLVLTALVVVLVVSSGSIAGIVTNSATSDSLFQSDIDADSIEMDATIHSDGDADWRVVYRLELTDDEEFEAFETLQADIEAEPGSYLDPFEERIQRTADAGEAATQREMAVGNFSVETTRTAQPDAEFGEVVFRFEWAGFAAVQDGGQTIHAGDALDSFFLEEQTTLTLRWPESYQLDSHTPPATTEGEQRLTWRGPFDFDSGEPRVVLHTADEGGTDADVLPATPVLLLALVVAGALVALWLVATQRRRETEAEEVADAESGEKSAEAITGEAGEVTAEETGEVTAEETTDEDSASEQDIPSELLSNEERVLALLEHHDGRMKQKKVAETFDWSAAKTSQVVSTLREQEQVETFRIGRENVLTFPDVGLIDDSDSADEE